jgi:IS1 family transposase/transposase-like protein
MKIVHQLITFLILLAFLFFIGFFFDSFLLNYKPRRIPREPQPRTPRPLKPKCEDDCCLCQAEKGSSPNTLVLAWPSPPWCEVRSRRGRKKSIHTQGYACNNPECIYYHVMEESIHALVGYGYQGKQEPIQDLMCQACKKKFTVRRDTALYRLKTRTEKISLALALLAEGVDVSALERVLGIGEGTLRTWLTRAGMHAAKLHSTFFQELIFRHIQLDELWANVRHATQEVWLWVATEATTKIIPVMQLGPRSLDMAMAVVHGLRHSMQPNCSPVITTDGLKLYFYALSAHFGGWSLPDGGGKPIWQVATELLYAQVKKVHRRRKLVKVERTMLCGELATLKARLQALGLTGNINTAFVERLNLAIRQGVSFLVRRTWGTAQFAPELELHLEWWRAYYHFSRYHESLRIQFPEPVQRKGKQLPCRYRGRTPAMAAGFASRRWSVLELLSYPLSG